MRGYHIRIQIHDSKGFIPNNLFQNLPSHSPKPTANRNTPHKGDYRYGPLRIDWVDFDKMNKKDAREPATAVFVPKKSGSTNLPEGIVHVFRDSPPSHTPSTEHDEESEPKTGVMLGIIALPSWMTPSDFLTFVAPAIEGIAHLRMIRDSSPNRSIVVIYFPNPADASEFVEAYNGRPFNSMEPENCHVVRVHSVTIDSPDVSAFATPLFHVSEVSQSITTQSPVSPAQDQTGMYELPTCPVCLERMDSAVTGLITVPCAHTFHCMCLSKWGDSRCPVCRYSQTLLSSHASHPLSSSSSSGRINPFGSRMGQGGTPTRSSCHACASTTNLWICLICGNIGCGRYGRAHAHAHYISTCTPPSSNLNGPSNTSRGAHPHLYALELETQRVWDYAGDGYVHRLIQNKADGKLVELPSASMIGSVGISGRDGGGGGMGPSPADTLSAEKIEAIGIEYSYLLTSQLDSQREFYEEQAASLRGEVDELKGMVQRLIGEVEATGLGVESNRKKVEDELYKDKLKAEKKASQQTELARKVEKELREERLVSSGLLKNLATMKIKVEDADRERMESSKKIADLEDQVRDVMFFLEAKTKIEQGEGQNGEAQGGSIEMPIQTSPPPSSKKKKSKKG